MNERPLSRRGVLSIVAPIFDPLGFVAPFILVGKQTLQQMCQDKIRWDEPLSDDLRPQWESWLLDLQNLAYVKFSDISFQQLSRKSKDTNSNTSQMRVSKGMEDVLI